MEIKIYIFKELAKKFNSHGFNLYLVGGTVRDYLLGEPLTDVDCVSEATPEEIASFLPRIDKTFIRFGYLKFKSPEGVKFDITTLRKESAYLDGRHPSKIEFVKDLKEDPLRILRAIRFHLMYKLKIYNSLLEAMKDRFYLLENITDAKIRSELNKIDDQKINQKEKNEIFSQFDIANLHGVIK